MSMYPDTVDPAIRNLSLNNPQCNNDSCIAFQAAHNLSQAETSYYLQFDYGHWVAWYYSSILFVGALVHLAYLYRASRQRQPASVSRPSMIDKAQALFRYLSYRRSHGALANRFGFPSCGMLVFLLLGVLLLFILTFAVRPYYRQHRGYGSPPLAVRTGLMAASLTPLLMALSGKVNLVTLLTGLGHEKLNVIHRWVGWSIFGLSVAHTVPFIVAPLQDGGYQALHRQFYSPKAFEYTGVPPLAILFGVVLLSLPYVRHRVYERFYYSHIILAVTYLGLCFWHFGQEGDSWAYLWATLALWLFSILGRVFFQNKSFNFTNPWLTGLPTRLRALPGDMTRIDVLVPSTFSWRPGQHSFIRFPSFAPFDNHPFTIASIPQSASGRDTKDFSEVRIMSFFVRSHTGFTRKLSCYSNNNVDGSLHSWVDGPYGGIGYPIENMYDTIILIAGGTGITACLPWLQHIKQLMRMQTTCTTNLKLLWIMRDKASIGWISQELEGVSNLAPEGTVMMEFFVTSQHQPDEDLSLGTGKEGVGVHDGSSHSSRGSCPISGSGPWRYGRPNLIQWIPQLLTPARNIIIACGPESLKIDVSNASALAQRLVFSTKQVEDITLMTETFGW